MDAPAATVSPDYERDAYGWAMAQAALLRARSANAIDWDNIAEEIESVGKSERSQLASRLEVLCEHLIKLALSADRDPRSGWWQSVTEQRERIEDVLNENPSLRPLAGDVLAKAWRHGAKAARAGLIRPSEQKAVPPSPFLTFDQAMTVATDDELRALLPR